jgi:hypothetical protein
LELGEFEEARVLAQQAYAAALATFGPDHTTTVLRKQNLDVYLRNTTSTQNL